MTYEHILREDDIFQNPSRPEARRNESIIAIGLQRVTLCIVTSEMIHTGYDTGYRSSLEIMIYWSLPSFLLYHPQLLDEKQIQQVISEMLWLAVLVAAIAVAMMLAIQEVPIVSSTTIRTSTDYTYSEYNIIELDAPAMSGFLLTIITWIVTRTPLRPFILRFLLNQNEVHLIRDLAATKLAGLPPTYYPLARLSAADYDYHVQAAQLESSSESSVLSQGLPLVQGTKYRTVMDYHQLYLSGKATPTQVLTKVLQGCDTLQHLHIFSSFRHDNVLQQAAESDERYKAGTPLSVFDGMPIGVKDVVHVQGHVLCYGSLHCSPASTTTTTTSGNDGSSHDVEDDILVARFRQAGAIIPTIQK